MGRRCPERLVGPGAGDDGVGVVSAGVGAARRQQLQAGGERDLGHQLVGRLGLRRARWTGRAGAAPGLGQLGRGSRRGRGRGRSAHRRSSSGIALPCSRYSASKPSAGRRAASRSFSAPSRAVTAPGPRPASTVSRGGCGNSVAGLGERGARSHRPPPRPPRAQPSAPSSPAISASTASADGVAAGVGLGALARAGLDRLGPADAGAGDRDRRRAEVAGRAARGAGRTRSRRCARARSRRRRPQRGAAWRTRSSWRSARRCRRGRASPRPAPPRASSCRCPPATRRSPAASRFTAGGRSSEASRRSSAGWARIAVSSSVKRASR